MQNHPNARVNVILRQHKDLLDPWKLLPDARLAEFGPDGMPVQARNINRLNGECHSSKSQSLGQIRDDLQLHRCVVVFEHVLKAARVFILNQSQPIICSGNPPNLCVVIRETPQNHIPYTVKNRHNQSTGKIYIAVPPVDASGKPTDKNSKYIQVFIKVKGKKQKHLFKFHQMLCFLQNGFNIKPRNIADHTCAMKICVCPLHMQWTTQTENCDKKRNERVVNQARDINGNFVHDPLLLPNAAPPPPRQGPIVMQPPLQQWIQHLEQQAIPLQQQFIARQGV
jgi:hypothetical protein